MNWETIFASIFLMIIGCLASTSCGGSQTSQQRPASSTSASNSNQKTSASAQPTSSQWSTSENQSSNWGENQSVQPSSASDQSMWPTATATLANANSQNSIPPAATSQTGQMPGNSANWNSQQSGTAGPTGINANEPQGRSVSPSMHRSESSQLVIGENWTTIPAGTFWMGTPDGKCPPNYPKGKSCKAEVLRESNETLHLVTLTHSFAIKRTEVTQGEFVAVTGWNPSYYGPNGEGEDCGELCPVENVSWYDALAYANELSVRSGLPPCYVFDDVICLYGNSPDKARWGSGCANQPGTGQIYCEEGNSVNGYMACMNTEMGGINSASISLNSVSSPYQCEGYRLLTEAEWEYSVRAGSLTPFYPSSSQDGTMKTLKIDAIAWCHLNLDAYWDDEGNPFYVDKDAPQPVGGKEPNA